MSSQNQEPSNAFQERFKREEARFRHAGYFLFFGLGALVFLPLGAGIILGLINGKAWDPFTSEPVTMNGQELDCQQEATDLIYLAGQEGEIHPTWEERYRRWGSSCGSTHKDFSVALSQTHRRLANEEAPPTLD